jgi:hypothetical protein
VPGGQRLAFPVHLSPWTQKPARQWPGLIAANLEAVLIGNAAALPVRQSAVDFDFISSTPEIWRSSGPGRRLGATVLRPNIGVGLFR